MSASLSVRVADRGAALRLAALHAAAFDAEPWDAAAFDSLLASPGVMALTASDPDGDGDGDGDGDLAHAVGFVLVRHAADEAEILTLAVVPQRRREGIAARLIEAAAVALAAQGAAALFLEVAEDNAPARTLYRRAGFEEVGRRRGYYARKGAPACDALVLRLALGG